MSYVGTGGENTRAFGTPAKNTRDTSFAQLSRGIIPKPYLKGKSISAFGAMRPAKQIVCVTGN